eukprot:TRINITY_DN63189_c0_g1_i1.p1 TRINITY_DN63189_c0_g1~~TRINITY_DN63189_c0_g1_i1.p1  ORF type:complete len:255 (-),score=24.62 TRINITY_DN63189_c0_g1_i1:135-809(-)
MSDAKNVVHEMSTWKQLIETELRTARDWDSNWGFLKAPRRIPRHLGESEVASVPPPMPRMADTRLATPREGTAISTSRGAIPAMTPRVGAIAPGTSYATTPRGATPRSAGTAMPTPRGMAATGMAVLQQSGAGPHDGGESHGCEDGLRLESADAGELTLDSFASTCGDDRLRVTVRGRKTPKERFSRQTLTSHELGWGTSLEKFGVNHYGLKRREELWPEISAV